MDQIGPQLHILFDRLKKSGKSEQGEFSDQAVRDGDPVCAMNFNLRFRPNRVGGSENIDAVSYNTVSYEVN